MSDQSDGDHLVGRRSTGEGVEIEMIAARLGGVDDVADATERAAAAIDAIAQQLQRANEWATQAQATRWSEELIGRVLLNAEEFAARAVADAEVRAQRSASGSTAGGPVAPARQMPHPEPGVPGFDADRRDVVGQVGRRESSSAEGTDASTTRGPDSNGASVAFDVEDLSAEDIGAIRSALEGFASTNTELVTVIARLAEALAVRKDEPAGTRAGDQSSSG